MKKITESAVMPKSSLLLGHKCDTSSENFTNSHFKNKDKIINNNTMHVVTYDIYRFLFEETLLTQRLSLQVSSSDCIHLQ